MHPLGLVAVCEVEVVLDTSTHQSDARRARLVLDVLGWRDVEAPSTNLGGESLPEHRELPGIAIGERPQEHCVDDREDRRIRADAEREHDYGNRGKPRRMTQRPKRVAKIREHWRAPIESGIPQRHHGIDGRRATRRQPTPEQRHRREYHRHGNERQRIRRADLVQQRRHATRHRERPSVPMHDAERRQPSP